MKPFEDDRFMLDPYFHPYLAAAQEHDMTITIHIANANQNYVKAMNSPYDPSGGLPTFRMPTVHACNGLILSDLPKRFPDLRWGFIESSCQWVPWIMHETSRQKTSTTTTQTDYQLVLVQLEIWADGGMVGWYFC